jgi:thymidylate synthase (FAD)
MKIVKPSMKFLWVTKDPLKMIELAGRTCYKSEEKITKDSSVKFVKMLLDRGHEAMIEHASMSYRVICDRGVSHEIVRHRLFSYAQESTRYCNYYTKHIQFIEPDVISEEAAGIWWHHCIESEAGYYALIEQGCKPEIARSVLNNSLKTEIVITGNLREWKYFFKLRTDIKAHPQMREIAGMILKDARQRVPIIFD